LKYSFTNSYFIEYELTDNILITETESGTNGWMLIDYIQNLKVSNLKQYQKEPLGREMIY